MNWKKWIAPFLAILLALGLAACQDEKNVSGALTEIQLDEDGNLSAFVLKPAGADWSVGVKVAEGTRVWPYRDGPGPRYWESQEALMADFLEDFQVGCHISAWCYPRRERMETAEGERISAYWAQSVDITGILERGVLTLRDGTPVDVLEQGGWGGRVYRLADGTELLRVDESMGPENCYVEGLENFSDLNGLAQEKIRAYYEEQGLLYDELEELEKCLAAWRELGEDFRCEYVHQEVTPTAASERVIYFSTSLMLPAECGTNQYQDINLCAAFDRETGEKIDTRDLFGVPWAEVRRRIPELVDWDVGPAVMAQVSERLEPEYLSFDIDSMSVWFPAGALEGEEYPYGFSIRYSDAPGGFFQPWAIPESAKE